MNHAEKAVEYYSNNFNCSQGVFTTYATEMGMDEKMALMLATNFGGGERKGELCGAVAGALMVLGLRCGHYDSNDMEKMLVILIKDSLKDIQNSHVLKVRRNQVHRFIRTI